MNAQPMETAPRDGTHILAANLNQANPIWTAVHWFDERWYLSVNELELHAGWQCDRLTHWLPQPPTKIIDFPSSECRPNPETQAVAYRNPETGHVCSREKWESMGSSFRQGMRQPLYAAPEVKENDD